jgi:hypothetical protein
MTDVKWNECMLQGDKHGLYLDLFFETDEYLVFAERVPLNNPFDWVWSMTLKHDPTTEVPFGVLDDDEYDMYRKTINDARLRIFKAVEAALDEYN